MIYEIQLINICYFNMMAILVMTWLYQLECSSFQFIDLISHGYIIQSLSCSFCNHARLIALEYSSWNKVNNTIILVVSKNINIKSMCKVEQNYYSCNIVICAKFYKTIINATSCLSSTLHWDKTPTKHCNLINKFNHN